MDGCERGKDSRNERKKSDREGKPAGVMFSWKSGKNLYNLVNWRLLEWGSKFTRKTGKCDVKPASESRNWWWIWINHTHHSRWWRQQLLLFLLPFHLHLLGFLKQRRSTRGAWLSARILNWRIFCGAFVTGLFGREWRGRDALGFVRSNKLH